MFHYVSYPIYNQHIIFKFLINERSFLLAITFCDIHMGIDEIANNGNGIKLFAKKENINFNFFVNTFLYQTL